MQVAWLGGKNARDMRIERFLDALASRAIEDTLGVKAPAILRPTQDPKHGDYQVNGVMPLAKQQKRPPREPHAEPHWFPVLLRPMEQVLAEEREASAD